MNMTDLNPFEFDQTNKGWRSLEDPAMQVLVLKEYIDKHKDDKDEYMRLMHFHLGQVLAFRNLDENDITYAIHHMKESYSERDEMWNDYVDATIAFLQKNELQLRKYVNRENYNGSVIRRLYDNFGKDYKDAY